ncbi:MAG: hypothetical protein JWQ47_105 [Glaciihabitans sp.]|jgi:hypothetical protein|nr:hypothetical protein [Glaciihabitans sp.]
MTLTHILPSLRRTLPDPLSSDSWPEYTVTGPDDVTVAGLSLVTLVQWCGTPCVHTAAAVIPGTHGRPSETELASVVMVRVTAVTLEGGRLQVWIDGELDGCKAIMGETRMIGRVSTAHATDAVIYSVSAHAPVHHALELPVDLRAGDVLAIPCVGVTMHRDVQSRSRHPERLSDDRVDYERDEFPFVPCGK